MTTATAQQLEQTRAARATFRDGNSQPTSGIAAGITQANLICVPRDWAYDVLLFASRNPKPCPVLEVLDNGTTESVLAPGSDIRTDIGKYRVWRDGTLVDEPCDVVSVWAQRHDMVSFLIGCSFTFETALTKADIPLRHRQLGRNVPMYRTSIPCTPAGRLQANMVVSMRPIFGGRVADAVQLSGCIPAVHGAPIHIGEPAQLGIDDISTPDFGDPPQIHPGELPVFWACGVTPQVAVMASKVPFAITHAPGYMFLTDIPDTAYIA